MGSAFCLLAATAKSKRRLVLVDELEHGIQKLDFVCQALSVRGVNGVGEVV